MRVHLTDLTVRSLKAEKQTKFWDTTTRGFGIRVQGTTKSWMVMYGARRALKVIGRYPDMPLAKARTEAKKLLAFKPEHKSSITFAEALDTFITTHCEVNNRPSTKKETERILRKHFAHLNTLHEVTHKDINAVIDAMLDTPSMANHVFTAIRTFMKWAVRRRLIEHSPCDGLQMPATNKSRDRVLSDDEIRVIWKATWEPEHFNTIVRLLLLTGQRRGEIAALRPEWISDGTITLPKEICKNGREHTFPIGASSVTLIAKAKTSEILTSRSSEVIYLFPARGKPNHPFNGWSKSKAALDKKCGVKDWSLHDLRRTFATKLAALGMSIQVTEKLLNHASGMQSGIVAIYNRHSYFEEMKAAIAAWEKHLSTIVGEM